MLISENNYMYDVAQLKDDIAVILHGTTLNSIQSIDALIFRAASELLEDLDPQETKRILQMGTPLFRSVYDYPAPGDLKGNKIIDIRPQANRKPGDQMTQMYNQAFDVTKGYAISPTFTINFNNAFKTIRLQDVFTVPSILVNNGTTPTGNGTWALGGDASNLQQDSINYVMDGSSLRFELSGLTGVGYIENSTMEPINLSRDIDQGYEFLQTFLPFLNGITPFNSVELRWGSSPTDYWYRTVSVNQELLDFQNGWNQLAYEWANASTVGSPDVTNITYLRYTFNYDVGNPIFNVRINALQSGLGSIYEIEYYSKYLFRDLDTGGFKERPDSDTDLINLDTETYMVFTNKCAHLAAQQNGGLDGQSDIEFFRIQYLKSLQRYQALYKSEIIKPKDAYYRVPKNRYRRWWGSRWN